MVFTERMATGTRRGQQQTHSHGWDLGALLHPVPPVESMAPSRAAAGWRYAGSANGSSRRMNSRIGPGSLGCFGRSLHDEPGSDPTRRAWPSSVELTLIP